MLAAMAEWLRRLTRNQMGSSRVGSNPTCSEMITVGNVLERVHGHLQGLHKMTPTCN